MSEVVRDLQVRRYFMYRFAADIHETPERFGCAVRSEGRADIASRNLSASSSMTFDGEGAPGEPVRVSVVVHDGRLFQRFDQAEDEGWIELADTGGGWLNELLPLRLLELADSETPLADEGVSIVGVPVARIPDETFSASRGEDSSPVGSLVDPAGAVRVSVTCDSGTLAACEVRIPCTDGKQDRMRIELAPTSKFEITPPAEVGRQFSSIDNFMDTATQEHEPEDH